MPDETPFTDEQAGNFLTRHPRSTLTIVVAIAGFLWGIGLFVFNAGNWFEAADISHDTVVAHEAELQEADAEREALQNFQVLQVERQKTLLEKQEIRLQEKALRNEYIVRMCEAGKLDDPEDCERARQSLKQ